MSPTISGAILGAQQYNNTIMSALKKNWFGLRQLIKFFKGLTRFRRSSFLLPSIKVLFHIFYYNWDKENCS